MGAVLVQPSRPRVAVSSAAHGGVSTLVLQGPQGAVGQTGETGARGEQGYPGDYGYIRYGEMVGATPRPLLANVTVPFVVQQPQVMTNALNPPFDAFVFLDTSNVLRARKAGDSYDLDVRFNAVANVYGGAVRIDVFVIGNISGLTGPTASRTVSLKGAAGSTVRVDEILQVFPQSGFLANGATIMLTPTVDLSVSSDVLFVSPRVAAP